MNPTNARRISRIQRQIHQNVRAEVRKALGPQSRDLIRYYGAYKREFRDPFQITDKDQLLNSCLKAQILLMGDYHTFSQSQKAALRLLEALKESLSNSKTTLALGLEMVCSEHQEILDAFLADKLSEQEYLKLTNYEDTWGFSWEHFKPLLEFAKHSSIKVVALNKNHDKLESRDQHAARIIASFSESHPTTKLFVLYGDLHLARGHIPRFLKSELRAKSLKRRILTIFQNSESLYWKLSAQGHLHVDVLDLGKNRFCIMSAAPWIKLQSYLHWAESKIALTHDDAGDNESKTSLLELAHDRIKNLAELLHLTLPENLDFSLQTIEDLSFLTKIEGLSRNELKAVKYQVLGNRIVFIPNAGSRLGNNVIYLPSSSMNSLCEGLSRLIHCQVSKSKLLVSDPKEHFYAAVIQSALAYFGSKVLNHKRKCDLEEDFRKLLARPKSHKELPQEKLQRSVAKQVLKHCHAQKEFLTRKKYRAPLTTGARGKIPLFLEVTRSLGAILGEKLYFGFVKGTFQNETIQKLFKKRIEDSREARHLYLDLVEQLDEAPLMHTSKLDLF